MSIFSEVAKGFTWLGKEILTPFGAVKKAIVLSDDLKADAETLLPQVTVLVEDVDALAVAAVKDGGAAVSVAETLVAAIVKTATDADAINIAGALKDVPAVVAAFEAFIAEVTAKSTWSDVLTAQAKLITDYDTLGASAKTAVAKLQADV